MNYEEIISFGELYKSLNKVKRGVMWKDSVSSYYINGLKKTYLLQQSLLQKTYKISDYQHFVIHEPKTREITATRIKDRQFQRSLCDNYVYNEVTKHFIRDNYACQKGRGIDDTLNRFKCHLHRYYRKYGADGYILKCDIHHFFPETDHDIAKYTLSKYINDKLVLEHLYSIIDSFDKGIGLGSQVSQLLELSLLNEMDHYIKEYLHIEFYSRYMDDFILISNDREYLKYCLKEIKIILSKLGFTLNSKTQIIPLKNGITFLKWRFILTNTGKVIMRMNKKSIIKEKRKIIKLQHFYNKGLITKNDLYNSFNSWKSNAMRGQTNSIVVKMERIYEQGIKSTTSRNTSTIDSNNSTFKKSRGR